MPFSYLLKLESIEDNDTSYSGGLFLVRPSQNRFLTFCVLSAHALFISPQTQQPWFSFLNHTKMWEKGAGAFICKRNHSLPYVVEFQTWCVTLWQRSYSQKHEPVFGVFFPEFHWLTSTNFSLSSWFDFSLICRVQPFESTRKSKWILIQFKSVLCTNGADIWFILEITHPLICISRIIFVGYWFSQTKSLCIWNFFSRYNNKWDVRRFSRFFWNTFLFKTATIWES